MFYEEQRLSILKRIETGDLTVDQGAILLDALARKYNAVDMTEPPLPAAAPELSDEVPEFAPLTDRDEIRPHVSRWWKFFWSLFFWAGVALTVLSSFWLYQSYSGSGFGWGFWLSWIPFAIGILLMALGWQIHKAHWLHLRVEDHDREGKKILIVFSIPLPLSLGMWFLRTFRAKIPQKMQDMDLEAMLHSLSEQIIPGEPMVINIDGGDENRVMIIIE